MQTALRIAVAAPAVLFVLMGMGFWVAPALVSEQLGMTLLDGAGLSTQIADLASFFMTLGSCILIGLVTGNPTWLYPAMLLLGIAASGRVLAWAVHGAALTYDSIAVEVTVVVLLAFVSQQMTDRKEPSA